MPIRHSETGLMTPIFRLGVVVLASFLFLSGCSSDFSDNPVNKVVKSGDTELNFSNAELEEFFNADKSENQSEKALGVTKEEEAFFNDYIDRINSADTITYTRIFSSSEEFANQQKDVEVFFKGQTIYSIEQKQKFVFADPLAQRRLLNDGEKNYIINVAERKNEIVAVGKTESRNILKKLCKEYTIEMVSIGKEQVENAEYTAYDVLENSKVAKWYFGSDGNLAIRVFIEDDIICAVHYSDFKINPSFDENLLTLDGAVETAITEASSQPEESSATVESSASSASESSREETPQTEGIKTPGGAPQTSSTSSMSSQTSSTSSTSSQTPPKTSSTSSTQQQSSKSVAPPAPSVSDGPDVIIDYSTPKPITPKPPASSEYVNPVDRIRNFPSDVMPIMHDIEITDYDDNTRNQRRRIQLHGDVNTTLQSVASYYEDHMSYYANYSLKEMYDEETGATYYVIKARQNGWNINIEMAEDHVTLERTIYIQLEK